ncbi:phosphotransferase enzyme family protein [Biscogniauxia mediterranea]|nr:phosphotransferase enzyme family protein [Biscogniauxia mediterranea]
MALEPDLESQFPVPMPGPPEFPEKDRVVTQQDLANATKFGPVCCVYLLNDKKTVVKTGGLTRITEATTMEFVRRHTSIPIPKVYNAYHDKETGHVRIIMENIEGETLENSWDKLTDQEKESVIFQLKGYFEELRQIEGSYIGSVDGSFCEDQYFDDDPGQYGPYKDESEFTRGLVKAWIKGREDDAHIYTLCQMALNIFEGHKVVMTHNDFDPRNILVRGSRVVAIIDWEKSGFYPEHWEYCKALWRPGWTSRWMKDHAVHKILTPYWKELAVIMNTSYSTW